MQDKKLVCSDCSQEFDFTVREQEFYQEKGFENEPKRCPDCRRAKKQAGRQSFEITCADCGEKATVPFEPKGDGPLYCRECFGKHRDEKGSEEHVA